jgi:hypothetical protein
MCAPNLLSTRLARSMLLVMTCSVAGAAIAQPAVNPIRRFNTLTESLYLLERCGALTPERRDWLLQLRDHALRIPSDMTPQQWAAHEAEIRREFAERYPTVSSETCATLVATTDRERASLGPPK